MKAWAQGYRQATLLREIGIQPFVLAHGLGKIEILLDARAALSSHGRLQRRIRE
jgi:hypothetical protein